MKIVKILLFLAVTTSAMAQYNIQPKYSDLIKNGILYVIVDKPKWEYSQPYIKVAKETWTISNVEVISFNDMENYLKETNAFLDLRGISYQTPSNASAHFAPQNFDDPMRSKVLLELWTPDMSFVKNKETFSNDYKIQIARVEQMVSAKGRMNPQKYQRIGKDESIITWGEGLFKNYLQNIMKGVKINSGWDYDSEIVNKDRLPELKTQKLFIPDFTFQVTSMKVLLGKYTYFDDTLAKQPVLKEYKGDYEIITSKELNAKILEGKPFYYLLNTVSGSSKFISIVNGQTGEIVYLQRVANSYGIHKKDMKSLSKSVGF